MRASEAEPQQIPPATLSARESAYRKWIFGWVYFFKSTPTLLSMFSFSLPCFCPQGYIQHIPSVPFLQLGRYRGFYNVQEISAGRGSVYILGTPLWFTQAQATEERLSAVCGMETHRSESRGRAVIVKMVLWGLEAGGKENADQQCSFRWIECCIC